MVTDQGPQASCLRDNHDFSGAPALGCPAPALGRHPGVRTPWRFSTGWPLQPATARYVRRVGRPRKEWMPTVLAEAHRRNTGSGQLCALAADARRWKTTMLRTHEPRVIGPFSFSFTMYVYAPFLAIDVMPRLLAHVPRGRHWLSSS